MATAGAGAIWDAQQLSSGLQMLVQKGTGHSLIHQPHVVTDTQEFGELGKAFDLQGLQGDLKCLTRMDMVI